MPTATFEIEVYCATCGDGLCHQSEFVETRNRHTPSIRVEACQKCLDRKYDEAYDKGYQDAMEMFT